MNFYIVFGIKDLNFFLHEFGVLAFAVLGKQWVGLNQFHGANLTLSSDVDQDTWMFSLHERPLAYQSIISKTYKSQDIKRR